ncbi:MAG: Holliday junction branch migration protein RuvA [Candidatus Riflebacteria bacterium]|nr:Holliday junction branch migration protein RuvA [Candidatus Riflebacteria bacterium]
MIDFVTGKLFTKEPLRAVVNNHGIGIELLIPLSTSKNLPNKGEDVTLLTYLHWRQEDSPLLFGFYTEDEREIFKLLVGVNKVGPKMAVNIMSAVEPEAFASMILSEDVANLTSLKGVGPKLASRLVIELKEKIAKLGIGSANAVESIEESHSIPFESDVREGLEYLGYSPKEIAQGIKRVSNNIPTNATAQDVISMILQSLN